MTRSLRHISEKPWSEYTKADYTPEQWHKACLIHLHDGTPTSKGQCKLPVRTPGGALSRPGVHAAAAALAGARGGVDAPSEKISSAKSAIRRLYSELGDDVPDSLKHADDDFDLEEEYGWFLDGILKYVEDNPDDFLEHYGVPGMKWGVRRDRDSSARRVTGLGPDRLTGKTKSGETITMTKKPPPLIARAMSRISPKFLEQANNFASMSISDSSGKKIGSAQVVKVNKDELNLIWLDVNKSSRGKGYATAAMHTAVDFARQTGVKKVTLEVPANSPDARHIYEKMGFKATKEISTADDDPMWGGLTQMEYQIPVKHNDVDAFFAHYGIPGMKWGVRKRIGDAKGRVRSELKERTSTETTVRAKPGQMVRVVGGNKRLPHEDAVKARTSEQIAKRSTLDALSNKDLQHLVQRMNLEQQYRQMAVKETRKSAALKWTEKLLSEKGDLLFNRLGPQAANGKKVVNFAFAAVTQNKALLGGSTEKKKDK